MNATPLQATSRTDFGKGAARKLRASGNIPALVYRDGATPAHITVDPNELRLIFQRSSNPNTILSIEVDGTTHHCLLTATQKHPVSRRLLHADFYEVKSDQAVRVNVPVAPVGKAKGSVVGGTIVAMSYTLPLKALPKNIPAVIELDVTEMDLGDFLRVSDITPPEGCTLLYTNDFNVFACKGRRTAPAGEETEAAAAAE